MIDGATRDRQSITADWVPLQEAIEGVKVCEVRNVPKENGVLTEVFRRDWELDEAPVDQVFQVTLFPGGVSAWHAHQVTTDRLFVNRGQMKIVLYDARPGSPTHGRVNEFRFGAVRPALVVIPPGVWHGVQNLGAEVGSVLNLVDRAYRYEDPDHWRLPLDTPKIPYTFQS
jgi:dTDP-4-dehydrorhamnose 3,5-epimerase